MNTNTNKKKILILLAAFLLCCPLSYAQTVDDFEVPATHQFRSQVFHQYGNLTYLASGAQGANGIVVVDNHGNTKIFNAFTVDGAFSTSFKPTSFQDRIVYHQNVRTIETLGGFMVFDNVFTNPTFRKFYNKETDIPNAQSGPQPMLQPFWYGLQLAFGPNANDYYYYLNQRYINRVSVHKVDSLVEEYPFPEVLDGDSRYLIQSNGQNFSSDLLGTINKNNTYDLWFWVTNPHGAIIRFKPFFEEFTVYGELGGNELPISIRNVGFTHIPETYEILSMTYYMDSTKHINPISHPVLSTWLVLPNPGGGTLVHSVKENVLLWCVDPAENIWDTMRIDLSEIGNIYGDGKNFARIVNLRPLPNEPGKVIALVHQFGHPTFYPNSTDWIGYRTFIIVDLYAKTYTFHTIPEELLSDISNKKIWHIAPWTSTQGTQGLGIGFYEKKFLFYNPKTSIAETEIESRGLPNLWVRNIYPNPATFGKVSAEIWCFLDDISTVELGLYDFMGKKVLDLSNSFEYEQATATISTTFEIPKSLAKGSYFLVVRSGKETRTKGIIVQ